MKEMIKKVKGFNPENIGKYYSNYAVATQVLVGGGTIQLLVELARDYLSEKDVYLEVGCYQAWNFSLVCHFARCRCLAVDNFSQDFEENSRYDLPTAALVERNIQTIGRGNGKLIQGDFRETLGSLDIDPIKLYFYDGPHEEDDQVDGIELALPHLADEALIFVDDWASPNVKTSTKKLLDKNKELSIVRVFDGPRNRLWFNQGQIVFKFERNK